MLIVTSLPRDYHRHARCVRHGRTDRTQQQARESSVPVTTDDYQLGFFGFFKQPAGRVLLRDDATDDDIRITLAPPGQRSCQFLFGLLRHDIPRGPR